MRADGASSRNACWSFSLVTRRVDRLDVATSKRSAPQHAGQPGVEGNVATTRTDQGEPRLGHRQHLAPNLYRRSQLRRQRGRLGVQPVVVRDVRATAQHTANGPRTLQLLAKDRCHDVDVLAAPTGEQEVRRTRIEQPVGVQLLQRIGEVLRRTSEQRSACSRRGPAQADPRSRRLRSASATRGVAPHGRRLVRRRAVRQPVRPPTGPISTRTPSGCTAVASPAASA